ncbi:hypothetical protein HJFPF1_00559 [Paramyrothecium foliicola]|nr:hypothetical protein HJFPF1_00559 [Paramyrothecium foliicola]
METRHHISVRELDLSACHHPYNYNTTISDRINAVPGIKTSAAFFTFLRANLVLNPSAMSSNPSTPQLDPWTSPSEPLPSASSPLAEEPLVSMDDIPPLYLEALESQEEKAEGLHLVADSVAQMSQQTARTLVFHPICVAALVAALTSVYRFAYQSHRDLGTAIVLFCGVTASYLVAIRLFASRYIGLAEKMHYSWLRSDDGVEDIVIGARFNNTIVGALVLRLKRPSPPPTPVGKKRNHRGAGPKLGGQGVIRAWTTKLRYRGQGVGRDLLIEAVRVTKERCGKDAEVGFAKEHANSVMVLPEMFNSAFRKQEKQATRALYNVLSQWDATKRKRRTSM